MFSDPIYKRDSTGNIRVWYYEVDGDSWRTFSGIQDGAMVASGFTVCTPKSQPTAEAQALFEAQAEEAKKLARTYHRSISTIDEPIIFEPMLAKSYSGKVKFPVFSQPKLDGIRCVATARGLFTRQGKPITAAPHIVEALEPLFELYPEMVVDGELYNHALKDDFNEIASIVRRLKNDDDDLAKAKAMIQFHVYDCYGTEDWPNRMIPLANFFPYEKRRPTDVIQFVDTRYVSGPDMLDYLYIQYMEAGYEGQMVRLVGPYEQKRSKLLLKRKEFQDQEFELVDVLPGLGNWAGYGKRLVCRLPDGREFGAGVKGNQAFTKDLLENKQRYIGGQATIKFFALTPDGIPRFPVATDFHPIGRVD